MFEYVGKIEKEKSSFIIPELKNSGGPNTKYFIRKS
jgi:hypothetical protein